MEKNHNKITSSRVAMATLAAQQHVPVREFLNQEPMRTELLADLVEGRELTLLEELLEMKEPVTARYLKLKHSMASATASITGKYINQYLTDFSENTEPLKARCIVISIPRSVGGVHVGYHFACFDTNTNEYLDGPATKELLEDIWTDFIKARLREKLEEEARYRLSEKLKSRNDYQAPGMEIGSIRKKSRENGGYRPLDLRNPKGWDHNRVWKPFDMEPLLQPSSTYIISSDVGTGKTTFLRYLQGKILAKTELIPIFVDASRIEQWKPENLRAFAEKLANKFNLKVHEDIVIGFLTEAFEKDIVLLVDGLDQIRGGGSEYERLVNHILDLTKNNVIIASRPSAVISQEDNKEVRFVRLKPFDEKTKKLYFGKHYIRARELSINAPDLITIPMLAYMVRTIIEKKEDEDIRNRARLYEKFINYILKKYRHGGTRLPSGLRNQIRQKLGRISYDALAEEEPFIQKIPLEYCGSHPGRLTMEPEELTKVGLVNLIIESYGWGDDCLYFTHQSFQEYLAAEWALKDETRIKGILDQMWNPKWKEVIKFLAGLLGEQFVRRIYSPEIKDNCIHSRLFLAAQCSGETGRICDTEEAIFEQLRKLVSSSPFKKDAMISLTRLNNSEAIEFLVSIITGTDAKTSEVDREKLQYLAIRILPQAHTKILDRHIDRLINMLEIERWEPSNATKRTPQEIDREIVERCRREAINEKVAEGLVELRENLSSVHIDKVVEIACLHPDLLYFSDCMWAPLKEKLFCSVNTIFKFILNNDENSRWKALRIMAIITWCHLNRTEWDVEAKHYKVLRSSKRPLSDDISFLLEPRHIEAMLNSAKGVSVRDATFLVFMNLMAKEALPNHYIELFLDEFNRIADWQRINIEHVLGLIFSNKVSLAHFKQMLSLMEKDNTTVQGYNTSRCPVEKLSGEKLAKTLSLLDSSQGVFKKIALSTIEEVDCKLTSERKDQIIGLLATNDKKLISPTIGALSSFAEAMTPEQVDKMLELLAEMDCIPEYVPVPFLSRNGEPFRLLPKKLTQDQIKRVAYLLDGPCSFHRKLGVCLLANLGGDLDKEYIRRIMELSLVEEPCIGSEVLYRLWLVHFKVSSEDISKIIESLRSQHPKLRKAAKQYLVRVKNILLQAHIIKLVDLLEEKDAEVAKAALAVLAEVPEKVPDESLIKIITILELQNDFDYNVPSYIAKFAKRFTPELNAKLISYVKDERTCVKATAIKTLAKMEQHVPAGIFAEIIECLQSSHNEVKSSARYFLESVSHRLKKEHVDKIVKRYKGNPANKAVLWTICDVPPILLAEQTGLFIDLLGKQETEFKIDILDILAHLAGELQPHHVEQVEKLLSSSEDRVQDKAYEVLRGIYTSCGLPA